MILSSGPSVVVSLALAVGRQSALPLLAGTVRLWAPLSEGRWVRWAALSLRHRHLDTATSRPSSHLPNAPALKYRPPHGIRCNPAPAPKDLSASSRIVATQIAAIAPEGCSRSRYVLWNQTRTARLSGEGLGEIGGLRREEARE